MKRTRFMPVFTLLISASQSFASGCGGEHAHSKQEMANKYFDAMDTNRDQVIDRLVYEESSTSMMIKSFDILQPDANGVVQRQEFIDSFIKAHEYLGAEV